MQFMTEAIHSVMALLFHLTGSYGWAILLLTLAVRVVLLPLYFWQQRSAKASAAMQAEAKAIKEQYKEKEAEQRLAELYQRSGGQMLAGCLPALMQWPVMLAMFRGLSTFAFALPAGFFWLENLAVPDPYFILPVLAVLTSAWQVYSSTPKEQRFAMMILPVLMGFFVIKLSAAVALYWVAGNLISLAQHYIFVRRPAAA